MQSIVLFRLNAMLPDEEIDYVSRKILATPEYFDTEFVSTFYEDNCETLIRDPFSMDIVSNVQQALVGGVPYSVIRIGDGEANLLSYSYYSETPAINRHVAGKIISMQEDRFRPSKFWLLLIQQLMLDSVSNADIVGVIGFWRPLNGSSPEATVKLLKKDVRGIVGHWRAIDFMLDKANSNLFLDKIVASAHLYFSVLNNLDMLIGATSNVYVVTDEIKSRVVDKLKEKYSHASFHVIYIGNAKSRKLSKSPRFLTQTLSKLPSNMSSSLSLVAAGPWAEIYCNWIKLRGGVALDIGSGFDLLGGKLSRPVHTKVGVEKFINYNLIEKNE